MGRRSAPLDLRRLDLNLLLAFVVLMEELSVTRASRRLFVSQSTTSGLLARLRTFFQDELLVRSGRGLEPTARAVQLLDAIRPHLTGLGAAVAGAVPFDPRADRRVFRLGCTDAFGFAALPRITTELRRAAPHCDLIVRIGDYRTLPRLLSGNEVGLIGGFLGDDLPANARFRLLRHAPWRLLRDGSSAPINGDLHRFCAREHALVTPLGDLHGFAVDDLLNELGLKRRIACGLTSFAILLAVLPGTDLIATVPDYIAHPLATLGGLSVEDVPLPLPPAPKAIAWSAALDRDEGERWFRDLVAEAFLAPLQT